MKKVSHVVAQQSNFSVTFCISWQQTTA